MNLDTVTFTPIDQGWDWILVGFGLITLLGISVLLYQFYVRKKHTSTEMSSGSIVGLVGLATFLAAASFLYSLESSYEYDIVEVSPEHLRTPFGDCKMTDVKSIYIYPDSTDLDPEAILSTEFYLIIEEKNGHRHPLSSRSYDIDAIQESIVIHQK
ncbi:MAG: hypothetical protein AB8F74_12570 [Saprospiraceae bacterium]